MKHTTIAVDVAKNVFEIAVSRCPGRVSETHRLSRSRFLRFFAQQIAGPHRDGSLRHGPFLGSPASKARSLRRASSPSVRQALHPSQQDGPSRRQRAPRGSSQQGHPSCKLLRVTGSLHFCHVLLGRIDERDSIIRT